MKNERLAAAIEAAGYIGHGQFSRFCRDAGVNLSLLWEDPLNQSGFSQAAIATMNWLCAAPEELWTREQLNLDNVERRAREDFEERYAPIDPDEILHSKQVVEGVRFELNLLRWFPRTVLLQRFAADPTPFNQICRAYDRTPYEVNYALKRAQFRLRYRSARLWELANEESAFQVERRRAEREARIERDERERRERFVGPLQRRYDVYCARCVELRVVPKPPNRVDEEMFELLEA